MRNELGEIFFLLKILANAFKGAAIHLQYLVGADEQPGVGFNHIPVRNRVHLYDMALGYRYASIHRPKFDGTFSFEVHNFFQIVF